MFKTRAIQDLLKMFFFPAELGPPTLHAHDVSLFVDIDDRLYCTLDSSHQVVRKSLNDNSNTLTKVCTKSSPTFCNRYIFATTQVISTSK